jgi:hypothetical protein
VAVVRLDFQSRAMQWKPLASALHCVSVGWMYRCNSAILLCPAIRFDAEGIHTRFTEPSQHGMTKRVQDKIANEKTKADGVSLPPLEPIT